MTRTWFVADTHFGHGNILKHCARPFDSVEEHDASLIAAWNGIVAPRDHVWHLGDFAFRGSKDPQEILSRLHGVKHLVVGNHDSDRTKRAAGWASVHDLVEVKLDGMRVTLCHYGMRTWPGAHHGALHLYGHSHGRLPGDSQSCDVGVDCWDYRPVSLDQVRERLAIQPPRGCQAAAPEEAA